MKIKTSPLVLAESYSLTPSVKHFVFSCEDPKLNAFTPGQFITMHFEKDGKSLKRSYSIANRNQQTNHIEFAAGFVANGPASKKLFTLQPQDIIEVNGPFGRLILKQEPVKRYLLVATSTGVTPYRAMLNQLSHMLIQDAALSVCILQGVQRREDLLYPEEFLNLAQQHKSVEFYACYSRETRSDLEPFEFKGYVQDKLKTLAPNPADDIAYLCGNPAMVDACHELLANENFDLKQIRREKYLSR